MNIERNTRIANIAIIGYRHLNFVLLQTKEWVNYEPKNALAMCRKNGNMEQIRKAVRGDG